MLVLTENRKMNEQRMSLKFNFKLGKTPKETYAMLVLVYEDQELFMKCVYKWLVRFRKESEVFLTTPVAEAWRSPSVTKTLRK
ncbi:hypothetical protein TNCV_1403231 [Trichonephila clavipes]|nr:hypothetical protein TNCV_1403231 [Trichonephila clavipes]